jgi:hypothetical protein
MGPKMLPTIWGTYMKLVTKYQNSAITKDYKIGICYFYGKHCLARNQNNVSEWGDMSICRLLFQGASTIKIQLSILV